MNNQKALANIMLELKNMGLVQNANIKSDSDLLAYMEQLEKGLIENNLANQLFLDKGYEEIRTGQAGVGNFYPSVPTFIKACTPKPEKWGLPTAQDAYNQASKLASSPLIHTLTPLVYMAGLHHWAEIGAGKGFKSYCVRYEEMFNKWVRGNLVLIVPPVPIAAPEKKPATEKDKMVGNETINKLIGGLND